MLRYKGIYWATLAPLMKKSLTKRYSEQLARMVMDNGKAEYQQLLERFYDIGEDNPLAPNAYCACVFLGAWLATGRLVSPEGMGVVIGDVLKSLRPFIARVNLNTPKGLSHWQEKMKQYEAWQTANAAKYPAAWAVGFNDSLHRDGTYFYFTRCPISAFCKREGMGDFMSGLYAAEKVMFQLQHGKLIRENATPKSDAIFDYWLVGDQTENPQ